MQAFYILSGFYMALVLSEKYHAALPFYRARLKRLFPIYWLALATSVLVGLLFLALGRSGPLTAWWQVDLTWQQGLAFALANASLLGLDWMRLTATNTEPGLGQFIVVAPSWTIGIELTFYLFAPLLIRLRTGWLILLIVASLAARHALYARGDVTPVWTNGFFPFELSLFIVGMTSYRVYGALRSQCYVARAGAPCLVGLVLVAIVALPMTPPVVSNYGPPRNWLFLLAVAASLPAIFARFRSSRWDRIIGEYSYPIYMFHFLIGRILEQVLPSSFRVGPLDFGFYVAAGAIACSFIALHIIPFERMAATRGAIGAWNASVNFQRKNNP